MRVKRYIVDTMPDAMQKIRDELGKDAVILSTKELKIGGFLGMFQKRKIEVIAASESKEATAPKGKPSRPVASSPSFPPIVPRAVPEAYRKSTAMTSQATGHSQPVATADEEKLPSKDNRLSAAVIAAAKEEDPLSQEELLRLATHKTSADTVNPASAAGSMSSASTPLSSSKEDRLFIEIEQMKMLMTKLARFQEGLPELPEPLSQVKERLAEQEVSPELADVWVDEAFTAWENDGKTMSDEELVAIIRASAQTFLKDRIGEGIQDGTKVVYIVGPTGVGKTTTIAKLAADQIFRLRKKVGFITADTYRISAIEQLRTYASILNVPLEVVQSPGDVQRAMQRLEHCDLILMDTAGRNYLNELYVAELHSLLSPSEHSETYLVLSLTSKSRDMMKITEHFSKYGIQKVIFTKLDETQSVGPIYNLLHEYPMQVSYVTNGQNVPDDLLSANNDLFTNMLLGAQRT
ncbi:flagellar biosynthesis protein FlhF [Paenibacillus woosongensis]|uniref:Flagellar biosynthesis protein FlhF n=1 Tax=Paenibacillus woosongensis TaxID=307580 RepID=A0AA95IDE8_9BACL|nr:flagellar biosynthesis protein FlhF [Paenibacillus woosongensis]WHX51107.1 flagellar biosynthesis protein FlhF [Paenibacillus woosongensis]